LRRVEPELSIRPARRAEAGTLYDLAQRAYGHYVERIGRRPGPMDADYEAHVAAGHVSVAVRDGELAGFVVLVPADDHLLVENVAVEPAHQGRGAGGALLDHAERTAVERGLPELRLYTNAAMTENRRLYAHLGYTELGARTDEGFNRIWFSKPVRSIAPE
jgi:ribosomal protein S18 acetylase RimI-like enzyme